MKNDISTIFRKAWENTKNNWPFVLILFLAYILIITIIDIVIMPDGYLNFLIAGIKGNIRALQIALILSLQTNIFKALIIIVVGTALGLLIANVFLRASQIEGRKATLSEAFRIDGISFYRALVASIIINLIEKYYFTLSLASMPTWLFIISTFVVIYLLIRIIFIIYNLLDEPDNTIGDALIDTWKLTENNVILIAIIYLILCIIAIIGTLCCCIGLFIAVPFIGFTCAQTYQLLKNKSKNTEL